MMETLLIPLRDKMVILEYRKADGRIFRFVCWLRRIESGFIEVETTTRHQKSLIAISAITNIGELPSDQVRKDKVNL